MPGPPPKDAGSRRRRNASPGMTPLPAEGRAGPPPKWPFVGRPPARWATLWARPQAVAWEQQGLVLEVAGYTRLSLVVEQMLAQLANGESPKGLSSLASEKRQIEDRLGLSSMALLRLRWEVVAPDEPETEPEPAAAAAPRRRLKVGTGDAVARP